MAREHNIDLAQVEGSGLGGRITKQDILDFLEKGEEKGAEKSAAAASSRTASAPSPAPRTAPPVELPGDVVPLTRMRKIIAERMIESRRTSAHVHCMFQVDLTRIVNLRNKLKNSFEQRHGVRLTFMPFFVRAAIIALQQYPIINASLFEATTFAITATSTSASLSRSIGDSSFPSSRTPKNLIFLACSAASPISANAPGKRN